MTVDGVEFGEVKVMGSILNPVDGNSFVDLAIFKDEDIFVDKRHGGNPADTEQHKRLLREGHRVLRRQRI